MDLLFLEHLNGVVPSHSSVRSSTSDKDNFGLSFLGIHDGTLSGKWSGGGFGNISVDESCGSLGCEREHCGSGGNCCTCWEFHFVWRVGWIKKFKNEGGWQKLDKIFQGGGAGCSTCVERILWEKTKKTKDWKGGWNFSERKTKKDPFRFFAASVPWVLIPGYNARYRY